MTTSRSPLLDDPRLTDYALGELPPDEARALEAQLATDPQAQAHVDELRAMSAALSSHFASEPTPALSDDHRRAIDAATHTPPPAPIRLLPRILALAAVVALLVGVSFISLSSDPLGFAGPDRSVALNQSANEPANELPSRLDGQFRVLTEEKSKLERPETVAADKPVDQLKQLPAITPPPPAAQPAAAPSAPKAEELAPLPLKLPSARFMGTPVQIPSPRPATSSTVASAPAPVGQAAAAGGMVAGEKNLRRLKADTNGWEYAARDQTLPKEREEAHDRDRDVADALGSNRFNPNFHTEGYDHIVDNAFIRVADHPLSTFSIDVDTASYANIRRMLTAGSLPPPGAVRIEEMVNYFTYNYGGSGHAGPHPFVTSVAVASAPWAPSHRLVRLGIQAKSIPMNQRSRANLVFLLDVSGSMSSPNKLPLVREAMKMLLTQLRPDDTVAIVVYAGASGLVLDATPVSQRQTIIDAIDQLTPGGSTNGAAGIQLAYNLATQHFVQTPGGINRVILATDGDFNVGVTSQDELVRLIEDKRKSGVFLSVFGFGMGNLKDSTLEKLADKGNGNYGYIDTLAEARKNFIEQAGSTLITVAKDVKIQIEFNPAAVAAYRLIGYENRLLAKEDFNDDTKDAGEIGSGHTVTALYEIIPAGSAEAQETAAAEIKQLQDRIAEIKAFIMRARLTPEALQALNDEIARHEARIAQLQSGTVTLPPAVDELKYQKVQSKFGPASELMTLKLRYKQPDGDVSTKLESPVADAGRTFEQADNDFQFAASVAAMGMMLRNSPHKGALTWDQTLALAQQAVAGRVMPLDGNVIGADRAEQPVYSDHAYRLEFVELIKTARQLAAGQAPQPVRPE